MPSVEVDKTKERLYELHALGRLAEAEQKLGYVFIGVRNAFAEWGAVVATIRLLDLSHGGAQEGFTRLAENGLLEYSIEQSVLDSSESGLFPKLTLLSARLRLDITRDRLERERNGEPSPIAHSVPDNESRSYGDAESEK
jgi:hypothetical protein